VGGTHLVGQGQALFVRLVVRLLLLFVDTIHLLWPLVEKWLQRESVIRLLTMMKETRQLGKLQNGGKGKDHIALLMDAQIKSNREECALGMGQSQRSNNAAMEDAKIKSSMEECALGMAQSRNNANYVALRDAQIKSSMEVCA